MDIQWTITGVTGTCSEGISNRKSRVQQGETANLQIKIANKGVIDGFKRLNVNQAGISDANEEMLAKAEMEEEKECTTAKTSMQSLFPELNTLK